MSRFVILSFVLMGWAFYELSGGADFEPRGLRSEKPEQVANVAPAARSSLNVPTKPVELVRKDVISRTEPVVVAAPETEPVTPELTEAQILAQLAQVSTNGFGQFGSQPGEAFTLAALDHGAVSVLTDAEPALTIEPAPAPEPQPDIREVSGTRVNMRDGPGTVYPIIARLNIGHEVEVLGDSGNGWLRLRVLPEQHVGWISESLVSKKRN